MVRRSAALEAIQAYAAERGQTPTALELSMLLGISSAAVKAHLRNLRKAGAIKYASRELRGITLCGSSSRRT